MPSLAYKQPALQRNKPMDYAKPAGSKMKKKSTTKKGSGRAGSSKKKQGYNARLDESLGARRGKKSQSFKDRRDESKGAKKAAGKRAYSAVSTMDK